MRTAVDIPVQGPGEQRGMQYSFGAYRLDPARYTLADDDYRAQSGLTVLHKAQMYKAIMPLLR